MLGFPMFPKLISAFVHFAASGKRAMKEPVGIAINTIFGIPPFLFNHNRSIGWIRHGTHGRVLVHNPAVRVDRGDVVRVERRGRRGCKLMELMRGIRPSSGWKSTDRGERTRIRHCGDRGDFKWVPKMRREGLKIRGGVMSRKEPSFDGAMNASFQDSMEERPKLTHGKERWEIGMARVMV